MKPQIIAVLIVGILALSVIATGVASIRQAVADQPSASNAALVNGLTENDDDYDSSIVSSFKLICPFH